MLESVASHLHRKVDLLSLSLTCKALHEPSMMQMIHAIDLYFSASDVRTLETTEADAIFLALMARVVDSANASTCGNFVRVLWITLDSLDFDIAPEDDDEDDSIDYHARRRSPASIADATNFLHWVTNLLLVCPNVRALQLSVSQFSPRLREAVKQEMRDISAIVGRLRALKDIICEDSYEDTGGGGHAVWHEALLGQIHNKITDLSLQFSSLRDGPIKFWDSLLAVRTNLTHLELQYGGHHIPAYSRRTEELTCRMIVQSPNLRRLTLARTGSAWGFPVTADVVAAIASHLHCAYLDVSPLEGARLDWRALKLLRGATNLKCVIVRFCWQQRLEAFLAHLPSSLETLILSHCQASKPSDNPVTLLRDKDWCPRLSVIGMQDYLPKDAHVLSTPEFVDQVAVARAVKAPSLMGKFFQL